MPEPIVLVWIGTIVTLLLVLLILLEIHRNNQRREHEEMFGSDEFLRKSALFRLTEKERHAMDKLVRRSVFSNKDALFNSSALFEDAVNRFYEYRTLDSIREITLSSVTVLRRKLGFTVGNDGVIFVSTRQFEPGTLVHLKMNGKMERLCVSSINEKIFTVVREGLKDDVFEKGTRYPISWKRAGDATYTTFPRFEKKIGEKLVFLHTTKIVREQQRLWVREKVDIEILAEVQEGYSLQGRLFDLSANGIGLGLPEEFDSGTEMKIEFELPSYGKDVVEIQILRNLGKKNADYPDLFSYSAKFIGDFAWTNEKVLQYIFELRRHQNRLQKGVSG